MTPRRVLFDGTNVSEIKSQRIEATGGGYVELRLAISRTTENYETASMWTYFWRNYARDYFEQRRHLRRRLPRGQHRRVVEAGRREFWRKTIVMTIDGIELRKPIKRTLT